MPGRKTTNAHPGGRAELAPPQDGLLPTPPAGAPNLDLCRRCGSQLVYPVEWAPVDMRRWRVELRCPECEALHVGVFEQEALDRFDAILDEATDSLITDLARLQRANMEEELERLTVALGGDLVLPEDF